MMEWSVPVNDMLNDEITKMNYTLLPPGYHGDVRAMRGMQECLSNLIDTLGEHSSAAQGLNRIITTADKLRNAPTHILYLLKDANAKNGHGEVIGFLKVAHKNLYLFDERDQAREVEPLCVLDFYIVEERQRSGYGRVLFDYMLHDMEVKPHQLAIDGPSPKMEKFMAKNYGITRLIRHSNNFAVAPEFFDNTESINNKSGRSTPTVAHAPVGRFAAHKPHSDIGNVIHGGASYYSETNNGDSSEREFERFAESPAPLNDGDRLPEPLPWAPPAPADDRQHCWDSYFDGDEAQRKECSERPQSLRVEPPAAPAPFADLPAAGLPTGTGTPSCGIGGGIKRDNNQLTDKGYFDVKNYHNRLW